jgi:type II secretory ATPase GspE/PulE/Tfp pilus assembly ATPase PilB-like protein
MDVSKLDPQLMERLSLVVNIDEDSLYVPGEGCEYCRAKTPGVIGRTVCAEVVIPDPQMLELIAHGDTMSAWRKWRATRDENDPNNFHGRTALDHAIYKMRRGLIAPQHLEGAFGPMDIQIHMADGVASAHEFGRVASAMRNGRT